MGPLLFLTALGQIDSSLVKVDEAVITGERDEVSASNSIRTIRSLGIEEIKSSSAVNLSDLLRTQLNIRISNDPVLGGGLSINGLGGNNIKIMVNGVPIVGRLNGEIDLTQIQIEQYDRIEIVEGPMAVEYGTNSLGGTINLISTPSATPELKARASSRYESVGAFTQSAGFSGTKAKFSGSVQLSRNYFDGWSEGDRNWDFIEDYYADSGRVNTWNPKLQHQVSASGQIVFKNSVLSPRIEFLDETISNKGYPRGAYGEYAFDDEYNTNRTISSLQYKVYGESGDVKWDVLASYQNFQRRKYSFSTDLTTLESELLVLEMQDTTTVVNAMTRGTRYFDINEKFTLRMGWDAMHETFTGKRMTDATKSMYDVAAFSIIKYNSLNSSHQLGFRQAYNSSFKAPLLPSYNTLFKHDKYRLRLSYAKGFRAPTLKELHFQFVDINHQIFGNESLIPETSHYFQSSLTHSDRHTASLRLFYNNVSNQIGLVNQQDGTFRYENFYSFVSNGGEIRVSKDFESLSVELGGSYIGRKNEVVSDDVNSYFTYTPEYSVSTTYDFNPNLEFGALLKYNGVRQLFFENEDGGVDMLESDPYTIIDASFNYTSPSTKFNLNFGARNLLNITTVNTASQSSAHSNGVNWVAWGRSYVISCSINI